MNTVQNPTIQLATKILQELKSVIRHPSQDVSQSLAELADKLKSASEVKEKDPWSGFLQRNKDGKLDVHLNIPARIIISPDGSIKTMVKESYGFAPRVLTEEQTSALSIYCESLGVPLSSATINPLRNSLPVHTPKPRGRRPKKVLSFKVPKG